MKQWKRDLILGTVLLAFSVVSFVYSYGLTDVTVKYFLAKADTYVMMWVILLAILALLLIVRSLRQRSQEELPPIFTKRVGITAAIIVIYVFLIDKLGFLLSSILFVFALLAFFSREEKGGFPRGRELAREVILWGIITAASVFLVQYLFGNLLGINLPQGIFK